MMRYRPTPSVVAVEVAPVPRFRALTFAPGTTAPDWSVTRPPMAPSVVDCANAPQANSMTTTRAKQNLTIGDCIPRVLIVTFFPFYCSRRLAHLGAVPESSGVAWRASSFRKQIAVAANAHSRQQPTSKFVPIFYHRNYLF